MRYCDNCEAPATLAFVPVPKFEVWPLTADHEKIDFTKRYEDIGDEIPDYDDAAYYCDICATDMRA